MKRKKKIRYNRIIICLIVIILIVGLIIAIFNYFGPSKDKALVDTTIKMSHLRDLKEANEFAEKYDLQLKIKYEYNDEKEKDKVISQNIKVGDPIKKNDELEVVISLGKLDKEKLKSDGINELGTVPIMMYHGIVNMKSNDTNYKGDNVDKDGYNRTTEAFREDLEFYYKNGYRMIRLTDYIDGNINVEYGKSPIILTFDDGNENNFKVNGIDEDGNLIIDENCAIGILESFKEKYPDYNITATFFVNGGLFNQPKYNEKILKWLVENGYDVGNHTENHLDIKKSSSDQVNKEIVSVYKQLDEIIPGQYVNIIALPFGSPYNKEHENFKYVLNSTYDNSTYETKAALRVGWDAEYSPFDVNFDPTFLKRCRAYDNNGVEFDIEMVFKLLKNKRYISDGNVDTIVISEKNASKLNDNIKKEVITY